MQSEFFRSIFIHLDTKFDVLYMFFYRLDERNAMTKSILHFDKVRKLAEAGL